MIDLVTANLPSIAGLCRKHSVRRLFLIGSATGTKFDPTRSDLDFLVEFEPQQRRGFDDVYFVMKEDLERLLGKRVDLVERHCVHNPYVRASMERTKVPLYAAA